MNLRTFVRRYCLDSRLVTNALIRLHKALSALVSSLAQQGFDSQRWPATRDEEAPDRRIGSICPELAATVFSHGREGVALVDPYGRVIDVNEAFTRLTGYGQDEVRGRELNAHRMVRRLAAFYAPMKNALDFHGHWSGEIQSSHKDGREMTSRISISAVHDRHGNVQHYVALLSDMTQVKQRLQLLERDARYDALTQLPNRLLLAERMRQALGKARIHQHQVAIAFIDLDGFKALNDSYGHDWGDRVLQIVAARINATLREGDTLARLGGDEFVAGLVGLQEVEDSEPLLKRMLAAANAPILIGAQTVEIAASIGVAFFPEHGQEVDALISKADQAMYLSKKAGGNRLAFCPTRFISVNSEA
ncbi:MULTISPECIES: sensor domain-containing diguanylate cyclase [unclassified Pseudomonas]|uniref:sensor domain-containing diguanylate cyclase n=1 Tax=unclassified Pseudomonas TaxID=196821 RepID=UPI00091C4D76|nr:MULTISPECIES: sensor domain-containing diguanylate cyclase [unclassified Pseudomonas]ROO41041.1 diguanylate cyclase [Pseudomonas sp. AF76]SFX35370.1 PAS domain S-box-containing protein/diguanylate cyclase (GGDEF) domain-containing protein [Pseudomonas sp. NFACC47-1]SFX50869.1 PAS domain S-box-containing protein/diguanylate cyclase (GGDEF) domain-containing protein [Pseudomonas sp. NFACC49-2]SFX69334.1 PAS domain S-box-containing protein/diguanylate cyclase (GGDEF) domain-containing protein [